MTLKHPIPWLLLLALLALNQNTSAQDKGRLRTKTSSNAPAEARDMVETAAQLSPAARPPAVWLDVYLLERTARYGKEGRVVSPKEEEELFEVLEQMADYCPGSEAYAYAQWVHHGFQSEHYDAFKTLTQLSAGAQVTPQQNAFADLTHGTLTGNETLRKRGAIELERLSSFSVSNLEFHRNALTSALPGGIIFTNGADDTYPLLMAQANGLRTDVQVIQIDWLRNTTFRKATYTAFSIPEKRFDDPADQRLKLLLKHAGNKHVYLATTLPRNALMKFDGALFPEGVLLRYAQTNTVDNVAQTVTWWENHAETTMVRSTDPICANYLIALAVLNNYYQLHGLEEQAHNVQQYLEVLTPRETEKRKVKQVSSY